MTLINEFETKMLRAIRDYERRKTHSEAESNAVIMYASAIMALKAAREERDDNSSGGI